MFKALLFGFPLCILSFHSFSQNYIFFLHSKFIEENPLTTNHPEYGNANYLEILDGFKKAGFIAISEKRPAKANVGMSANKVIKQIDSLLKRGIKASQITVIGTSKGGYIAQYVSSYLKNPAVNFVFIGCFQDKDINEIPEINFCGNILTIYEKSDPFGVSAIRRKYSTKLTITHFKEIELNTGLKHGFLFKPLKEWMLPCIRWANGNYK